MEGTVYWLVLSALLSSFLAATVAWAAGLAYFVFTLALTILDLWLAYLCWNSSQRGFLYSVASAIVISGLAFGILYSPVGALLLLLQLQLILFAYRAYRESRMSSSPQ